MKSILYPWVMNLGLRYQGTLLTTIRGSDAWSKYNREKPLVREIRGLILVPFDQRELECLNGFMTGFPNPQAEEAFQAFCENIDPMPIHYVMHVLHVLEIIAVKHPDIKVRETYDRRYKRLCDKFHLNPETPEQLDARMNEDRIESGTVGL